MKQTNQYSAKIRKAPKMDPESVYFEAANMVEARSALTSYLKEQSQEWPYIYAMAKSLIRAYKNSNASIYRPYNNRALKAN